MKAKVLVVVYNISKAQEHEWFVRFMDHTIFDIEFVMINGEGGYMHQFLKKEKIPVYVMKYSDKKNLLSLTLSLFRLIRKNRYDIVHTHLFEASLTGMVASWMAGVKKRINTRHYSDFHHVYNSSAVKYDRLINSLSTDIIAITENVKNILMKLEHVPDNKIYLIHHGIDFQEYKPGAISNDRVNNLKAKYNLHGQFPVIGVISKFIEWKGLQYIIPAFKTLLEKNPEAVLFLANAHGPYKSKVEELLKGIDEKNYRLVHFENDIAALYQVFDYFVHVPVTASLEAFGQVYIEALASKIPSVFTLSGIGPEFLTDKQNCYVARFKNKQDILDGINYFMEHPDKVTSIIENGYQSVLAKFDVRIKFKKLEQVYLQK